MSLLPFDWLGSIDAIHVQAPPRPLDTSRSTTMPGALPSLTSGPLGLGCRKVLAAAAMATLALAASVAHAAGPPSPSSSPTCGSAADMQRAMQLLNALRERGAPCAGSGPSSSKPLVWEPRLANTAAEHADDMARRDHVSHVDAKQRNFKSRLTLGGYEATVAGENLAAGQADFAATLQSWVDSPVHCATLMTPAYAEVGLACVHRAGSRYERFWVAHLALPQKRR